MKRFIYKGSLITALAIILLSATAFAAPGVNNYAGTGEPSFLDGKLVESKFNQPWGLAIDRDGNLIIVDSVNHKIRKVIDNEIITLAGLTEGTDAFGLPLGGHVDDDALQAFFDLPRYAIVDANGNLYISDTGNNVIRKFAGGKVYTYAGTGKAGYADGDRTQAQFNSPGGLALDKANNLYVADTLNHVIRKIDSNGTVTTYAGQHLKVDGDFLDGALSKARFNEPNDLVFDDKGNLYVSDSGNHLIRQVSRDQVSTFAGKASPRNSETGYMDGGYRNGVKEEALFLYPKGLAFADGVLFVADSLNNRIRAIKADGTVINLLGKNTAGDVNGTAVDAQLFNPVDVAYFEGKLYFTDLYNNKVKMMDIDLKNLQVVKSVEDILMSIDLHPASDAVQVWFDYENISFGSDKPMIIDSGIYLPVRSLFESWGAQVEWIGATREIDIDKEDMHVRVGVDRNKLLIKEGRTYIELDELAKVTKFLVDWIEDSRAIIIDSIQ